MRYKKKSYGRKRKSRYHSKRGKGYAKQRQSPRSFRSIGFRM